MRSETVSTKLLRIVKQSESNSEMVFTTLAHHMDVEFLEEAYHRLRKKAATGVDGVSHEDYGIELKKNLTDLHQRLRANRYRATPVKRVWIDKDDGSKRGIGIPIIEDKIVQKAVAMLLESVYEPIFKDFSYGFRPGRSAHGALKLCRDNCLQDISWIVDADIKGFFDNIPHEQLRNIIQKRVNDGVIIRLIGKFLNAGILEAGVLSETSKGTPQGGVISPLLANIYLHYVLDEWFEDVVRNHVSGNCFIVRFADDFVIGFGNKSDADKVFRTLPKRFAKYGLEIHPQKSQLTQFSKPYWKKGRGTGTYDFLGFTHYWEKTRKGGWTIKRQTRSKSLSRFMTGIWQWCKKNRHINIELQWRKLCQKLRGHYNYFAVRSNYKRLEVVYRYVYRCWRHWLALRCRKDNMSWVKFVKKVKRHFSLPSPKILHDF